jgi:DNA-binding CsgD family transcriptional regulator
VRENEYFQDYSLPLGRRFLMATNLLEVGPTSSVMALMRSPQQGPFGSEELALLERFRPDLERVARIHSRFLQARYERDLGQNLLDNLPACVIVTDAAANILRMNQAAVYLLKDGNVLRDGAGRLTASTPAYTKTIHQLVRQATTVGGPGIVDTGCTIIQGNSRGRHGLMITRLNQHTNNAPAAAFPLALVTITDLEKHVGSCRSLIRIFGLTPAEAKLAGDVAAGKRLDTLARERGVRMPTLRTQMRAIYGKTGTNRQAELAHLITSLPMSLDDVTEQLHSAQDKLGMTASPGLSPHARPSGGLRLASSRS